jgi:16S rRNA (adenine1518-N6/adenine1519-N6)-dimethyltransferase
VSSDDGLLGPAEIRQLAERLGVRPTKTLGQNFLHDPNTIRRIVRTAGVDAHDVVLEVGPGLGSLTLGLLGAAAAVVAVEIDPVLAAALPETVSERLPGRADRLSVLTADALSLTGRDIVAGETTPHAIGGAAAADPGPTALVANLPYNVAVPVVLHLLAELPTLRHGLVMVQAEVADRLAAPPGSRTYGVPSAKAAWYASVTKAGTVPRAVFWTVPNVDSGLVRLDRRNPPAGDRKATFAVVDAAFAQRRKTLRAALAGWAGGASAAEAILRAASVDPTARGETIDIATFARIAAARSTSAQVNG